MLSHACGMLLCQLYAAMYKIQHHCQHRVVSLHHVGFLALPYSSNTQL